MPAPKFTKPTVKPSMAKQYKLKAGSVALAGAGVAGLAAILLALFGLLGLLSFITMILLGVLHAEVALGIPAFGFWASFWLTIGWSYAASFFRSNNSK